MVKMAGLVGSPWLRIRFLPISHLFFSDRQSLRSPTSSIGGGALQPRPLPPRRRGAGRGPRPLRSVAHGNLHVGGARTALFNYLFARSKGGRFILRIEDTDLERSTKKSEEAMLNDLSWLGLDWDEGPGVGGDYGPYRQSERNSLYKQYAAKLLDSGAVYRCFCSNEELEQMKETAKRLQLPPVYTGKWATASEKETEEELVKGTPYTYRFRVPKEGTLKISDLIRGEVSWSLDTLGDFVIMRSNGQPVYNFCVTVDDATMRISHVIRAEEHLPNTLRQALIYNVLGFPMPSFAHVSLILAPDRSKLSKRHGATSVGQFREMGYLPQAMVNYLALLGWGDGTENEFFTIDQLERVNKSGAIFDSTKLRWMNGQHLRSLPLDELIKILGDQWKRTGILLEAEGSFVKDATELLKDGIDLITDADTALSNLLSYPVLSTLSSEEGKPIVQDKLSEVAASLISAYDSGELREALEEGHVGWKKWVKSFGKLLNRKGKSLFMPLRVLLTGKLHGPDIGGSIVLIYKAGLCGAVNPQSGFVPLDERLRILKDIDWDALNKEPDPQCKSVATVTH
uniref:Glutamate--tRNA ligase, chloroplastic/mitochondrial n=1 Tax=Ananas comosus var. bracteatus TaxID=296719 RepID=A0A6V7QWI7_ANACO